MQLKVGKMKTRVDGKRKRRKAEDQYNLGYLICVFYALFTAVTDNNVRATVLLWGMSAVRIEMVWILTMDKALYNNKKPFE